MASFVCSPFSIDRFLRNGKTLQRQATETYVSGSVPGRGNVETCCKLRNRGGFNLPPQVPPPGDERKRAIELLGCCTQRKRMRSTTIAELKGLIGAVPPNRLIAQQWKGAIQRDDKKAKLVVDPNAFRHRQLLLEKLKLPEEDRLLSRCFILLDCLRRRYHANQTATPRVIEEITAILGSYPESTKEAHHYIRALAYMNRERRARERRPPRMLDCIEDMQYASMLLGTYSVRGSIGSQTGKLEELLGAVPRNRNVAIWWKKAIAAAIRKKKRRQRAAEKRIEVEAKRLQRRMRKLERELKEGAVLTHFKAQPSLDVVAGAAVLKQAEPYDTIHEISIPTHGIKPHREGEGSYLSRLYKFIGRFFVLKR